MKANRTLFFRALPIIILIMASISGCENESLIEQGSVGDLDTGPLSIEGYDLEVDANNYGSLVSGDGETRLYRTTVSGTETGEPIQDPYFSFYVKVGPDGERTVLKAIPNELGGNFSLEGKTNTFNGTVVEYGSNGAPKVLKVFERGTLIDESPLQEVGKERELSGREFWEPLRDWDDPNYNGRVSIFVERYTDVYFDRNGNGIPELSEYGYPVYNGGGWEYVEYGSSEYIPITNDTFHRHDWSSGGPSTALTHSNNEVIGEEESLVDPSCESFDYYKVGNTGVQVAGVNGIWDIVTKWDKCPGIGVAASYQTYYFHLPSHWNSLYAAERSADALAGAFFDLQKWFQKQPCNQINTGVLALKMDEFIKENFAEIGGQATRNAPLGWSGTARLYKEDWAGTDNCY